MPTQAHSGSTATWLWLALPVGAGVLLHAYQALVASSGANTAFAFGLFLWSTVPFAIAAVMDRLGVNRFRAAAFAWASLLGSVYMHFAVFVQPTGSTAALGLLFMPLWNLLLIGPAGLLAAWGLQASASGTGRNAA